MSVGHDEIVTRKRCVWFVCVLVIDVIKAVKDVVINNAAKMWFLHIIFLSDLGQSRSIKEKSAESPY